MNNIYLKGVIQDIEHSHNINGTDYDKANLIVVNKVGKSSIINLRFKNQDNKVWKNGDKVQLIGNVRSYSKRLTDENGIEKNKVDIYVYSHLDNIDQEQLLAIGPEETDVFEISGRICKLEPIRYFDKGKRNIHFVLANNIESEYSKLNSYLPCVAWGNLANFCSSLKINDNIICKGELHSREYIKKLANGEEEVRVAHELLVTQVDIIPFQNEEEDE